MVRGGRGERERGEGRGGGEERGERERGEGRVGRVEGEEHTGIVLYELLARCVATRIYGSGPITCYQSE